RARGFSRDLLPRGRADRAHGLPRGGDRRRWARRGDSRLPAPQPAPADLRPAGRRLLARGVGHRGRDGPATGHLPPRVRHLLVARPGARAPAGLDPAPVVTLGPRLGAVCHPESIAAKVTEDLQGGDVLLLHDADTYSAPGSHQRTAEALPRVLEEIERRGLDTDAL